MTVPVICVCHVGVAILMCHAILELTKKNCPAPHLADSVKPHWPNGYTHGWDGLVMPLDLTTSDVLACDPL